MNFRELTKLISSASAPTLHPNLAELRQRKAMALTEVWPIRVMEARRGASPANSTRMGFWAYSAELSDCAFQAILGT
jgi:hypothetical protein